MKFSAIGEFGFINRISRNYPTKNPVILKGIGDDAAVIAESGDSVVLLTADQMIEGIHFLVDKTDGHTLGQKALAVNLSDIAAMGGYPLGYTVSVGIPSNRIAIEFMDAFYEGITRFGQTLGVELIGGDTAESGERLFISIALLGKASKDSVIYRDGGKDGDRLYVTGWLGDAALGLKLLEKGIATEETKALIARHRAPVPRVKAGQVLAERKIAHAMIDVSDGLLADLKHLVDQSGVGAEVALVSLPLSSAFQTWAGKYVADPLTLALGGGEDYELLFSAPPEKQPAVEDISRECSIPITCIGSLSRKIEGIWLKDAHGNTKPADPLGYDHFTRG